MRIGEMPDQDLIHELPQTKEALLLSSVWRRPFRKLAIGRMTRIDSKNFKFRYLDHAERMDAPVDFFTSSRVTDPVELGDCVAYNLKYRFPDPDTRTDFDALMSKRGINPRYARYLYKNDILTLSAFTGCQLTADGYSVVNTFRDCDEPFDYIFDIEEYNPDMSVIKQILTTSDEDVPDREATTTMETGDIVTLRIRKEQYGYTKIECIFYDRIVGYVNQFQVKGLCRLFGKMRTTQREGIVHRLCNELDIPRLHVKVKLNT